jgi:outer membrane lipoprotein-sorting protein
MVRALLCGVLGLAIVGVTAAAEREKIEKKMVEGEITRIDHKKRTVTMKVRREGKVVEKTFSIRKGAKFFDHAEKPVDFEHFRVGHRVHFMDHEGGIVEMRRHVVKEKEIRRKD